MNAYFTIISTDSYLLGALALHKSLCEVKSKYKLYVLLSKGVSKECENKLKEYGIDTIRINDTIKLPHEIMARNNEGGFAQWNNTLDKLYIFDCIEFNKIVYLDADMMVTKNIDELFEYKHLSAVVAGKLMPENKDWNELNSGTMVIEPQEGECNNILTTLDRVSIKKKYFGDQDLLQEYYSNWPNEIKLHLDQKYNVFNSTIEFYVKNMGYNCNFKNPNNKTIAVVHFEGKDKPWKLTKINRAKTILRCIKGFKFNNVKVYIKYFKLLSSFE